MHLDFEHALQMIERAFDVPVLLDPGEFASHVHTGRIDEQLLEQALIDHLQYRLSSETSDADPLTALQLGSRHTLRKAMLLVPEVVHSFDADAWMEHSIEERSYVGDSQQAPSTAQFQMWLSDCQRSCDSARRELLTYLEREAIGKRIANWTSRHWTIAHAYALWWCCGRGTCQWQPPFELRSRLRQSISAFAPHVDATIREVLVPLLSAYVDPGVATWSLPHRDQGLMTAFAQMFGQASHSKIAASPFRKQLTILLRQHADIPVLDSIETSLRALDIGQSESAFYLQDLANVLRGWSGLLYHLQRSDLPCQSSVRRFSCTELVAVMLLIERCVLAREADCAVDHVPVAEFSRSLQRQAYNQESRQAVGTRRIWIYQLAQHLNWSPENLMALRPTDWSTLHYELNRFTRFERQWVAQLAFEKNYQHHMANRLKLNHAANPSKDECLADFLLITCAEPQQESIRRHVESIFPRAETVGVAGFFNLDIKFKDSQSSHYVPHAPTNVHKRHLISEVILEPPFKTTSLEIKRPEAHAAHGFTIAEMATVTARLLIEAGIAQRLPRMVIVMGHESSSINNLFEAADNCTFCSKKQVRVNTRAFVQMANDYAVREAMRQEGVFIPDTTLFVGAVYNTCSDTIHYLDVDSILPAHHSEFEHIVTILNEATGRNAVERCEQLLQHAPRTGTTALEHCEARQESGAYARPEYGLLGNAMCIFGRRQISRGVKLDRRAFLFSYDARQDDDELSDLARLLSVNLPVLANINFDYWFSRVAPERFGAGRKAELNLVAGMAVSDEPHGDLRVGLPYEMVDQHEPMRLWVVLDASPEKVWRMLDANPRVVRFFARGYMHLSVLHEGRIFAPPFSVGQQLTKIKEQ